MLKKGPMSSGKETEWNGKNSIVATKKNPYLYIILQDRKGFLPVHWLVIFIEFLG